MSSKLLVSIFNDVIGSPMSEPCESCVVGSDPLRSNSTSTMLGLICDPIANRVEALCLGKNVMPASNALACANIALAGYDPAIPLDEVIETAQRVAGQMRRELRCTALAGLSITPTSMAIEERLAAKKAATCGSHRY